MLKNKAVRNIIIVIICLSFFPFFVFDLKANAQTPPSLSGSTYSVSTASHLRWIAGVCNGTVSSDSKNYPSNSSFAGYTIVLKNSVSVGTVFERDGEYVLTEGEAWTPIGTEEAPFSGTFNGGEYSVSGVFVEGSENYSGFFGVVENGTVNNLTVKGYISGSNVSGGIAGKLSGVVSGCIFSGQVDGKNRVGGIVGEAIGDAETSSEVYLNVAACDIYAYEGECAGGIVGYGENVAVSSCSAGVNLYSYASYTAGVIGMAGKNVSVSCCNSDGTIIADGQTVVAGGILGLSQDEIFLANNSFGGAVYSSAEISSVCGGIAGSFSGKIENSFVNGGVYSSLYFTEEEGDAEKICISAGIAAEAVSGEINNCYFSGISEKMGEEGDSLCPDERASVSNSFYSYGIAYIKYGTEDIYHVMALLDELKSWTSANSGYSSWQSVSGINDSKPLLKHTNAAGSNGKHAWKVEGTTFTYYTDGKMDDYTANIYGIINTPWAVYRASVRTVTVKEGVTRVGNNAFNSFDNLRTLNLPSSLTEIGDYAFEQCVYLKNFTFPANLSDIGEGAFRRCKALTKVSLPKNIKAVRKHTFAYCEKLASVTIPNSVSLIGYMAFSACDALTTVSIPQSVREIDDYAFYYCEKLETVELPTTLNRIGECAFGRCDALVNFDIPEKTWVGVDAFWSTLPKGDIDGDGRYTVFDYLKVKAHFLGTSQMTKSQIKAADSDFDGRITASDYLFVKASIFGKNQ